ncbi:geranylgeranylglycerol-phosphate geranylgeranyltransferase [Thermogladius sp. 4427co]|uniref:geranylgeranylglycerol-phosphate geranylgeranyltransferase n=1 Tax=Thermogladius sp. 4427co TaxID=3450718 RepID=UPI003F795BB1
MTLLDYLAMTRPLNSFMSGLGALISLLLFSGYRLDPWPALTAFLTGYLSTSSSMLVNDYVDAPVDRLNKPWKPIPSGRADPGTALALGLGLGASSVLLNLPAGPLPLATVAAYTLLGVLYSFSRKHWQSHFMVSASTTGPLVYGYILAGTPGGWLSFTVLYSLIIFSATTGREVVKALQDLEGDRALGYKTIPVVYGVGGAKAALAGAGLASLALSIGVWFTNASRVFSLTQTILAAYYLREALAVYRNPWDKERLEKTRVRMITAMLAGLLALSLAGLPL